MSALLLGGCGGGGPAAPPPQVSTFRTPQPARWTPTAHPLGRGAFRAVNVTFSPAGLLLTLPAGTLDGGELRARRPVGPGTFTARLRSAGSPGSISAFFLYRHDVATDSSDELDVEIPGGAPHHVLLTVWRRGVRTPVDQRDLPLDFDPAAGLHDYAFARTGTDVRFTVDGREVFRSARAPDVAMTPMFNAWYPTWQTPADPPQGGQMLVDRYTAQPR